MEIVPDPDQLAAMVEHMEQAAADLPAFVRGATITSYALGHFAAMFVSVAREHGPTCAGCEFCRFLAEGLTMVSAYHVLSPELAVHDIWGPRP
ncbi:hypothetical protein AB0B66_10150 [Catellatospora sp. NPDC049111]|uniref:hypothetical protein n=1 Tax=Catellatospora sp. NPDC049111 TaxID=3155271 RepID=UPI0033FE15F2